MTTSIAFWNPSGLMKGSSSRSLFAAGAMLCALLFASGCGEEPANKTPAGPIIDPTLLSGDAAFSRVAAFVALGPKPAGTPAAEKAALWIREELSAVGLNAEVLSFDDKTPRGSNTFHNVRAILPGDARKLIIISCHFDTKTEIADDFAGANDSGSGVGLLIELASVLKKARSTASTVPEIHFAFFDGEECQIHYGVHDGFHGSRKMADDYVSEGRAKDVVVMINLDMVGDQDLSITIPQNSDAYLVSKVFEASHNMGCRSKFRLFGRIISDDHTAFLDRGMPAIDLIDFAYGSAPSLNDYWHTDEDTLDKIKPESLELVGRVTLEMLNLLHQKPRATP